MVSFPQGEEKKAQAVAQNPAEDNRYEECLACQ